MHMHVCTGMHGAPPHTHNQIHPPPTSLRRISQISTNSISLDLNEIIWFCLKIWNLKRLPHLLVGWLDGWGHVKSLKLNKFWPNRDNSILFEDLICGDTSPMGGCMGSWVGQWVGSCQITRNRMYLDLIEIIQFCLKIYEWEISCQYVQGDYISRVEISWVLFISNDTAKTKLPILGILVLFRVWENLESRSSRGH